MLSNWRKMKTAKQLGHIKKAKCLLKSDPDYFAKLAARRKGESNPNMARKPIKEASALGGKNRGQGVKNQQRKARSEELQKKIEDEEHKAKLNTQQREERKEEKHAKQIIWDEADDTVDKWE